jgi:hypothetical protein
MESSLSLSVGPSVLRSRDPGGTLQFQEWELAGFETQALDPSSKVLSRFAEESHPKEFQHEGS